MKRFLSLILILLPAKVYGQATVALSPVASQQFFSNTGLPLASGCLYTYISTTSTPLATYTDGTGLTVNTNPVILNAGGFGNLWLTNSAYRYTLYSKGLGGVQGTDCFSGTFQYTIDNVSAYTVINQAQNLFVACASSDPSGSAGELGCRSDLSNKLRYFSTLWDSVLTETGTATVTNKTLASPAFTGTETGINATTPTLTSPFINGFSIGAVSIATGNPTNFESFTNGAAGTTVNLLAKLIPLGSTTAVVNATTADIGGIAGITIAGAGASGPALLQRRGQVLCTFDGSTTTQDYVQISTTIAGNCHDTGLTTYPTTGGQIIGRVLTTNAGVGTYLIDLFGPEIRTASSASVVCTNFTPVTVTNNNTLQNLLSCTIPANTLSQGSLLNIDFTGLESTAANQNILFNISIGAGTPCVIQPSATIANNQPFNIAAKFAVLTSGAGGTANWSCEYFSSVAGGNVLGPNGIIGTPTIPVNTTISNTLLITEQMSVLNAGNSVTGQLLKATVF